MVDEIRNLLRDWGEWMRSDGVMPTGIGYPEQAVGAEMMQSPQHRSREAEREAERIYHLARQGGTYRAAPDGSREKVRPMIPQTQPKDSRGRKRRSPNYEPEPPEIRACHDAILTLPLPERNAVTAKYVHKMPRREAAEECEASETEYREMLLRAEGHIRAKMNRAA